MKSCIHAEVPGSNPQSECRSRARATARLGRDVNPLLARPSLRRTQWMLAGLLSILVSSNPAAQADELHGRVVGVIDSDTLDLLTDDRQTVRIRLCQIDAPERSQPFGQASKKSLSDLAFTQSATVKVIDRNRYGRTIGCPIVEGRDLIREQLRRGMAWVYTRYATDADLQTLEAAARDSHTGLWSDPSPIPPWDYRRGVGRDRALR